MVSYSLKSSDEKLKFHDHLTNKTKLLVYNGKNPFAFVGNVTIFKSLTQNSLIVFQMKSQLRRVKVEDISVRSKGENILLRSLFLGGNRQIIKRGPAIDTY